VKLDELINLEKVTPDEAASFVHNLKTRGVIFDETGNIGLLYVSSENQYILPGGTIEKGEAPIQTIQRECLEELGRTIAVIKDLGKVTEWRRSKATIYESWGFTATAFGKQIAFNLTENEKQLKMFLEWIPIEKAISLFMKERDEAISPGRKSHAMRELLFLAEAQKMLQLKHE
jgi:8-oxo-dGTP pyrophosphatase MutT (NUDIX family)